MKKRQWIVGLFALALLAGTVAFNTSAARSPKAASQDTPALPAKPPAAVVYSAFFHFVVGLQQHAAELEREGEKGDSLRVYVQTQAGLSDHEARKLDEIATACIEKVARQDARALAVIEEFRSQFPGGKIPAGTKVPSPPPELKVLQQERDQIILAARRKLATVMGETGFGKVEEFAERRITLNVQQIPSDKR